MNISECYDEARRIFNLKYDYCDFVVSKLLENGNHQVIKEDHSSIKLKTLNVITDVFREFGDLIKRVDIDFDELTLYESKKIVKFINDKSFRSLKHFILRNTQGNVLSEWTRTFKNVTLIRFSCSKTRNFITKHDQKLGDLAPNLEYFSVDHTKDLDWRFISGSFERLTTFHIKLPKSKSQISISEAHISKILESNYVMNVLTIENADLKLLNGISKHLSNDVHLSIDNFSDDYLNYEGDQVHFNSLKSLMLSYDDRRLPEKVVFDQLKYLSLFIRPEFSVKWLDFIANQTNKHLTEFYLSTSHLTNEHFLKILIMLTDIETLTVRCDSNFIVEDILKFVGSAKNLNNIEILIPNFYQQQKLRDAIYGNYTFEFGRTYHGSNVVAIKKR